MAILAIDLTTVLLRLWPLYVGIALFVIVGYLWEQRRKKKIENNASMSSYGTMVNQVVDFVLKSDNKPIWKMKHEQDDVDHSYVQYPFWKQARAVYIVGLALSLIILLIYATALVDMKIGVVLALPVLLTIIITARAASIFSKRKDRLLRMFEVANARFGYPKNASTNPWAYVKIRSWEGDDAPSETIVTIPAKWKGDPKTRKEFEDHFTDTVTDANIWTYDWEPAQGKVTCKPVAHLPQSAKYPGSEDQPWNKIPLGAGADGSICWDVAEYPHMLVCGPTGSGKSVFQRNIFFHLLQHSDRWSFIGVDPKRVELSPYGKYKDVVLGIGTNLEDGLELVRFADNLMNERYEMMEQLGVNNFNDLPSPPKAILIMVDETTMFLSPSGVKSDEGKEIDALKNEASILLGNIARLGRAAGVHLLLATQRPDATVIKGELKNNLDARVACGRMDSTPSTMVLDSVGATLLPKIIGRGVVRFGGEEMQFQGYFEKQKWADDYLAKRDGVAVEVENTPVNMETESSTPKKKTGFRDKLKNLSDKAASRFDDEDTENAPEQSAPQSQPKPTPKPQPKPVDEEAFDDDFEDVSAFTPLQPSPASSSETASASSSDQEWDDPFADIMAPVGGGSDDWDDPIR